MKNNLKFLLQLLILLIPYSLIAQTKIEVEEETRSMSKGKQPGYVVLIPEATVSEIKPELKKFLRKDSKSKIEEEDGEIYISGVENKSISPEKINIYTKLAESNDGVELTAFFTENDTAFISQSTNAESSNAIKKYLKNFAVEQYKQIVKDQLSVQQRKQKDLEYQVENLIHQKQKSEQNINQAKRTIENNTHNIESLNKLLALKEDEILKQNGIVNSIKGSGTEEEKLSLKNLKTMENEKKKLDRDREHAASESDKMNARIENEQRNIEKNVESQGVKTKELENQKGIVKKTEEKLNNIF